MEWGTLPNEIQEYIIYMYIQSFSPNYINNTLPQNDSKYIDLINYTIRSGYLFIKINLGYLNLNNKKKIIYCGNWYNGDYNGFGIQYYPSGNIQYEGFWEKGTLSGYGVMNYDKLISNTDLISNWTASSYSSYA